MIIDCISDLHGFLPRLDGGDLLIVAGDITACDRIYQWDEFYVWLKRQDYKKKVLIAGNHDGFLRDCCSTQESRLVLGDNFEDPGFEYLMDNSCEFEGLKIYGSPWTPTFCNWHFMKDRGAPIREKWDLIPNDTDILITHGPPMGILDEVEFSVRGIHRGNFKLAGCEDLRGAVDRIKPKLHVFGHIHESAGQMLLKHDGPNTVCVNACVVNEHYHHVNPPIRVIL